MKSSIAKLTLGAIGVAGLCAGCASNPASAPSTAPQKSESGWIQPSPVLRQQIEDEAERLPWTHGFERLEQIRWFASVGEPGYDTLLRLASDPRDDVAASALAALGATLDKRLVQAIHDLQWTPERLQGDLVLERARALVRLGDWGQIPELIAGLEDERVYTRSLCLEALTDATRETHDFDPRADEDTRKRAVDRWKRWWDARAGDSLLSRRS